MTNVAFPLFREDGIATPRQRGLKQADIAAKPVDAPAEFIELYSQIEREIGENGLVQFVCSDPGEGSELLATELATVAARTLGKRILLIDASESGTACDLPFPQHALSLAEAVHSIADAREGVIKLPGAELYVARLRSPQDGRHALSVIPELGKLLTELRESFDMVILASPAASSDPLSTLLAARVDGNVLVVVAERTRAPAVARLYEQITRGGGRVIGTVLNRRRDHVPRWLHRWL